jgi:phosphate transport system protein
MARLMDVGLEKLTSILLDMASLSEKSVTSSIEAYEAGRIMTDQIKDWSDELRKFQDEVSEIAFELIARYQPVATDLRYIEACLDISYGFSRFGRYAYDISEVMDMFGNLSGCDHSIVEITAKTTKEMIRMSIDAFANKDVELAKNIEKLDDFVDEKYRMHVKSLIEGTVLNVKCAISTTLILRYLERIADHSSYIGESVVYIVTGEKTPRK